jgi:hypothetical protein
MKIRKCIIFCLLFLEYFCLSFSSIEIPYSEHSLKNIPFIHEYDKDSLILAAKRPNVCTVVVAGANW